MVATKKNLQEEEPAIEDDKRLTGKRLRTETQLSRICVVISCVGNCIENLGRDSLSKSLYV